MNFSPLRDVTVASFLPPCLAHQRFNDVDSFLQGIGYCTLVFGGSFSGISSSPLRLFDALGGSWSQMVACNAGTAWCGKTAVGLTVTPTAFSLPVDPTCFRP